jgi:tripartite ATP-independent transporter DctP family solute receptor
MMSRRAILVAGSLSMPMLAGCQNQVGPTKLTACDVHKDSYPTVVAVKWLGDQLAKQTDGRLSIQTYPSAQLGGEDDTIALSQTGVIDLCRVNCAALNNAFPLTQAMSMPYVIESQDHLHAVIDSPIGQQILDSFSSRGLIGLASYDAGGRCLYNTHRPIEAPKDMRGLKIRVPLSDVFIDMMNAMGANPTPLSQSTVYSSLQSRLIDGAENNWPTFETSRHLEVARYWSQTRHSYSPEYLLMSKKSFDRLSLQDQALMRDLAKQSVSIMRAAWVEAEAASREKALAAGTQVVDVDVTAFKAACAPVVRRRLENEAVAKIYADIKAMA